MWSFVSSILRGKADCENDVTNDCQSSIVGSEEDDSSDEAFEDCLEGGPEVVQSYIPQKMATHSLYPPLSTIAGQSVPFLSRSSSRQAEISSPNSAQLFQAVSHRTGISTREANLRRGGSWNSSADDASSSDISLQQDLSDSTSPVYNPGLSVPTREDGNGSNATPGHGYSYSRIHRIPIANPREEFTSADKRYSESGPWSCSLSGSPRRVVNDQSLSSPMVLNERGSPANSCRTGVVVRPSPWSNVKCGVRARGSCALHPLGEDWSSFNELVNGTSQEDNRLVAPSPASSGTSRALFREVRSLNQTFCSSTPYLLQSQNSHGAFPLTNSPNCTVDRDSRQISQLRPQQSQGVNESSEKTAFDPVSSFGNTSLDPQSEERRQRQSHGGRSVQWPQLTEHLSVLGNFHFSSKVFPVLTRLKGTSLEESFTTEELQELGGVPKEEVTQYLWYLDGLHARPTTKHPPKRDADGSIVFRCTVRCTGKVTFEIEEEKNQASTLLQRVLGIDRVLKVTFEDGCGGQVTRAQREVYHRLAENGIFAGLRRYQYFAHKPSEKFEHKSEGNVKCYFVCTESKAHADLQDSQFRQFRTIADVRCLFMHIHTTENLSKYNSRLQLCLSKTVTVDLDWSVVHIEDMDDVCCQDTSGHELQEICTDGTGFISRDIAKRIQTNVFHGKRWIRKSSAEGVEEEYSSIFQVRLFQDGIARKGTLATNGELPPNTIRCYKSMVKVRRDNRITNISLTSLELVSTSFKTTGKAKLSQDLIVLLSLCKVPEGFFMRHLTAAMEKSYLMFEDPRAALEELLEWENDKVDLLTDMISAKISLGEPFLHKSLLDMSKSKCQDFTRGKFALDGTHYLMGTADPTGTLKRNQVTITLSEGPVYCSKVLVYRAPGKHPGDIHVFQATCNERLEAAIDTGKYAIYFSTQGSRPITDEIGKGDLDGDRYWICKNAELISYFEEWHCRWERSAARSALSMTKPAELSSKELERALFDQFLQARFNMTSLVGKIANRWLMHMDEYLHIKDCHSEKKMAHLEAALKLPSPYYDSLDYAKTGVKPHLPDEGLPARRPHYMEKQLEGVGINVNSSYHSESILGKIYDKAISTEHKWCLPSYGNFEVDAAFQIVNNESHRKRWEEHFSSYRAEMACAMKAKKVGSRKLTDPETIYLKYRKILYGGASSLKEAEVLRRKDRQLILEESSAIYIVVYETGKSYISRGWEPKLSFAWNVAGEALCEIYARRQPGRPLHICFDYFREVFERNKFKYHAPITLELFSD